MISFYRTADCKRSMTGTLSMIARIISGLKRRKCSGCALQWALPSMRKKTKKKNGWLNFMKYSLPCALSTQRQRFFMRELCIRNFRHAISQQWKTPLTIFLNASATMPNFQSGPAGSETTGQISAQPERSSKARMLKARG